MNLLIESVLRSSVVLGVALVAMLLLRKVSAATRHWLLSAAVLCAAFAPAAHLLAPEWRLPAVVALPLTDSVTDRVAGARPDANVAVWSDVNGPAARANVEGLSLRAVLLGLWACGALAGIVGLLDAARRLRRLTRQALPLDDAVWSTTATAMARTYGLRRPVTLLQGRDPSLLVTWGVVFPKLIVPPAALTWPADRVRLVLAHELAHVRRADWLLHLAAELLRVVYWFNPLVWLACRQLRRESEHACDDEVLARGTAAPDYAGHLLAIARELRARHRWLPVSAIAPVSGFEWRIRAMLDLDRNRRSPSRLMRTAGALVLAVFTIAASGLTAAQTFGRLTGVIADPTNAVLPGVTLVLVNAQTNARYEIQSNRDGQYEFVGLPPGEYRLETKLPGFMSYTGSLKITGDNLTQDLRLQVANLRETVTVRDGEAAKTSNVSSDPAMAERLQRRAAQRCAGGAAPATGTRIGGNLRAPLKIRHVSPEFPASMRGQTGTVELEGVIGTDGTFRQLNIVSATHNEFATAALGAVQQWQFDETLLNCVAIETGMKVTVSFNPAQ